MSNVWLEILLISFLIILNGLLSMSEISIVSARKARLQQKADKGDKKAQKALDLAASPNQFLSTVQIGITLIGILTGAFGGATLSQHLAVVLRQIRQIAPYSEQIAFAIIVLITTYLSLVLGELVPKRLGMHSPERIAAAVALPMQTMAKLTNPLVKLLSASTDLVLRWWGISSYTEEPVTEEEIKVMVEQGTEAGSIEEVERDMVESVFSLADLRVGSLMRPRTEVVWLDIDAQQEEIRDLINNSAHSRYPVCRDSLDNVLGVVQVKDLLVRSMDDKPFDLEAVLEKPLYAPESMRVLQVLELFKKTGVHISLVVDEYGVIQGLVTINDILEAIVGDIPQADENGQPLAIQREDGSWLLDGLLPVDEFKEIFNIEEELPGEGNYQSLGGFIFEQLGHIPIAGEHFQWDGLRLEVMDMDGTRVDKVLAARVPETSESNDEFV